MKTANKVVKHTTKKFVKNTIKTVVTAGGVTGVAFGAYHAKEFVSEVSDNQALGIAAGIATLLVGAVVINETNNAIDKAFEDESQQLLIEVSEDYEVEIEEESEDGELVE